MNERTGRYGLRAGVLASTALALAGCSGSYVGEDWQCPLAQGSVCASVAAADPAVPETRVPETRGPKMLQPAARDMAGRPGGAPPYRPRTEVAAEGSPGDRDCASACGPLAWFAGLFGASDGGAGSGERAEGAAGRPGTGPADAAAAARPEIDTRNVPPIGADSDPAAADAALGPAREDGPNDDLRAPETVARVWIAPWVDADGIYREGAWVRAVIAPAEWRLR